MAKVNAMLNVGQRSLMNSQTALQTTGHNIANKNTPGYSRQRVEIQSNPAVGLGRLQIGTGAEAKAVRRVNNTFLEKQIANIKGSEGDLTAKADMMARVEQIYNEQVNKGLNQHMSDFFNAWRELANSPESLATRSLVRDSADFLAKDFGRVHQQLRTVQRETDSQIESLVVRANEIAREMAKLNENISSVEVQGSDANDFRDRRDLLLKELSGIMDVKATENEEGQLTVRAGGVVLVSGLSNMELQTVRSTERDGVVDIYYKYSETVDPTKINNLIKGGQLGGMLDIRDRTVEGLIEKNHLMAKRFADEVNAAHEKGVNSKGQTGVSFFSFANESDEFAKEIQLNREVLNDVGSIAAGIKTAPGDNSVAHVVSSLQYKKAMSGQKATFDDFYGSLVAEVGLYSEKVNKSLESAVNMIDHLGKLRESVSGVNLDEEMANMIEYQKTYQASAKLIQTADEMLDTILGLKR